MDLSSFALRAVKSRYGSSLAACFFFGSAAIDAMNEGSDLDLIVVVTGPVQPYHEHFSVAGWLFDSYVCTEDDLKRYVSQQLRSRSAYFSNAILFGVPIYSLCGAADRIAAFVRTTMNELSDSSQGSLRLAITCLARDVRFSAPGIEREATAVELYFALLRAKAAALGSMHNGPLKYIVSVISKADPSYLSIATNVLMEALTGSSARILELALSQLNDIGGPFSPGERVYLPSGI